MILFKKSQALQDYLDRNRNQHRKIGFVPTMGALHEGHISLLQASRQQNDCTVCSIFVNPTQFNDPADFKKYPVTLDDDISKLEKIETDILFLPDVEEIYPNGTDQLPHYALGRLEHLLEGVYRPGHFQGVCQVMDRLLTIVQPDNLYMGQKDYQQCMVVKRLQQIIHSHTVFNTGATVREHDGLALSSRNLRLNEAERKQAVTISQVLLYLKQHLQEGSLEALLEHGRQQLETTGFRPDYLEIADAATLEPVRQWDGQTKLVALVAAYLHDVRLIDNMIITGN